MLNRAQEKAVELLDEFGIEDIQDVDIRDLVYAKDIIYREAPLENYDGRIVYGKRGKALITVNSNLTYVPRKRFTIAHELGHYILGHNRKEVAHDNQASMEFYKSGSQETEANQFASELLMPTSVFLEYIELFLRLALLLLLQDFQLLFLHGLQTLHNAGSLLLVTSIGFTFCMTLLQFAEQFVIVRRFAEEPHHDNAYETRNEVIPVQSCAVAVK